MLAARNIAPVEKCKGIKGPRQELGNIPSTACVHFFFRWHHFSSVAIGPIGLSAWKIWSHRLTQSDSGPAGISRNLQLGGYGPGRLHRHWRTCQVRWHLKFGVWQHYRNVGSNRNHCVVMWVWEYNTHRGTISQVDLLFDNVSSCAAEWLLPNFPGNLLLQTISSSKPFEEYLNQASAVRRYAVEVTSLR